MVNVLEHDCPLKSPISISFEFVCLFGWFIGSLFVCLFVCLCVCLFVLSKLLVCLSEVQQVQLGGAVVDLQRLRCYQIGYDFVTLGILVSPPPE